MSWVDWLIVIIPVSFIMFMGYYSRTCIRGVADYLSAGRVCGRYVISVANVAGAFAIITLVAYVEVHYKTGFALTFWSNLLLPLGVIISLTGYCFYRFRETRAMSLGQFLEMRYNRSLRIFASALRSISEILANMIMPAIAARFFIYFLDLPHTFDLFGWQCPTFAVIVLICLTLAISLICMGGTLAIIVTDAIQGMMCYPLVVIFIIFLVSKFSWSGEIVPVMMDRAAGESFLNPYDITELRDFNFFFLAVTIFATVIHTASWIGAGGTTSAKSPHEQKMANILGAWRGTFSTIFYVLVAVAIITLLSHRHFAEDAKTIRTDIAQRIVTELVDDTSARDRIMIDVRAIAPNTHVIGEDPAYSQEKNADTPYFEAAEKTLSKQDKGNAKIQEFRTLFAQLMLPMTMRHMLPMGLTGLFCLMMIVFMISTDDSRIYSASLTITQDCIVPFCQKELSPNRHIVIIRLVSIGVGVIFFFGSFFMAQLDYINLFVTIMCSMWMGGCGPVMIFGLYSRFGTTAGAFTSLITGMVLSLGGILVQRNWADYVYPWMSEAGLVNTVDRVLTTLSAPLNPYIVWEMNPVKCPVNAYEIYFLTMIICLMLYIGVSLMTMREPFNLERMLHRGKYALDDASPISSIWTWRSFFPKLIGITPEYTRGDKIIAWSVFLYTFLYQFIFTFILVVVWNAVSPWPLAWWGHYFLIVSLVIPGIAALFSTFWFGIGGVIDLVRLFRDLRARAVNVLDNGQVEGHISLADKAQIDKIDRGGEKS